MIKIGYNYDMYILNPYIYGAAAGFTNDKSLLFDGVDEYVDCGTLSETASSSAFSYSMWVKPTATSVKQYIWGANSTTATFNALQYSASNLLILFINGTGNYVFTPANLLTINNWHHISVVYNGSLTGNLNRAKIYVDGVDSGTSSVGGIPATTSATIHKNYIASTPLPGASETFNGNIDEFAFFDYALSSSQVTSLYNSGTPTDLDNTSGVTAPVHWWRMGDGDTFSTITDVGTTGGNNGTMTNMEAGDITTDVP